MLHPLESIITIVIAGLAVYRLAGMITQEDGVFGIFERGRKLARVVSVFINTRYPRLAFIGDTIGELFHCPYCMGVWLALFAALLLPPGYHIIINWLAIAGVQALLQSVSNRSG